MKAEYKLIGKQTELSKKILTKEAVEFVVDLHCKFNPTREKLLLARIDRQKRFDDGALPSFLEETKEIRSSQWSVAATPKDLQDRRVEITGPVERKMMINALNSGAKVFMADCEDACSPTWTNVIEGQINLMDAVRNTLSFTNPNGKKYALKPAQELATLLVRPRGWHLPENNILVDGKPISGSLFDFGMYCFHNAKERLKRGTGPYFYLPKLESHLEARLWNDVFNYTQDKLGIPRGTIRATVLIETILASFEMDEILYELKDHSAGFNAGRWDYIFSTIKKFKSRADFILTDRAQVTMTVPFMRAYTELLVKTCHHRRAHAIGGMSAFVPSRKDAKINEIAFAKVAEDKKREANDGFDGSWVAHPDLVPICKKEFDAVLGEHANQVNRLRNDVQVSAADLLKINVPNGTITESGVRENISVALQYLNYWLNGVGAAAINNLMEDAATAEISRSQLWQWVHHHCKLKDGRTMNADLYKTIRDEEIKKISASSEGKVGKAAEILDQLVLNNEFLEFLTIPGYEALNKEQL